MVEHVETKLLPCPFCGCTDVSNQNDGHEEWFQCDYCHATSGYDPSPEFETEPASFHWNRRATPPREALTAVCEVLLDEYELEQEQIESLVQNIAGECKAIRENRDEAAWERQQEDLMESGGPDDSAYRRSLRLAGRGHLLGD